MSKASNLINMLEASLDPEVQKIADQIDGAFQKIVDSTLRSSDLGNSGDHLYKIVTAKDGNDYALFNVPVITQGGDRAENSSANFKKIIDSIWDLKNKGYYLSQPVGKSGSGWENKNSGTAGTVMQFYFGKPK
jgi:hypothetical protein